MKIKRYIIIAFIALGLVVATLKVSVYRIKTDCHVPGCSGDKISTGFPLPVQFSQQVDWSPGSETSYHPAYIILNFLIYFSLVSLVYIVFSKTVQYRRINKKNLK